MFSLCRVQDRLKFRLSLLPLCRDYVPSVLFFKNNRHFISSMSVFILLIFLLHKKILYCVCGYACAMVQVWRSEDNLKESVLLPFGSFGSQEPFGSSGLVATPFIYWDISYAPSFNIIVCYIHIFMCVGIPHHAPLWKPAVDFGCPILSLSALLFCLDCSLNELGARWAANPSHPIFATHTFGIISTSS